MTNNSTDSLDRKESRLLPELLSKLEHGLKNVESLRSTYDDLDGDLQEVRIIFRTPSVLIAKKAAHEAFKQAHPELFIAKKAAHEAFKQAHPELFIGDD